MAEAAEKEVQKEVGDEEEEEDDEKEERKQSKGAITKKCSTCRVPLKIHKWPWGKKCPMGDLIEFEDEGGEEEDVGGGDEEDAGAEEEEEDDSDVEEKDEETGSTEEAYERGRKEKKAKIRSSPVKKKSEKKGKKRLYNISKATSTPRRKTLNSSSINGLSFVAGSGEQSMWNLLLEKMEKIDLRIDEVDKRIESDKRDKEKEDTVERRSNTYRLRDDIQILDTVSEAQRDILDIGVQQHDTRHQQQRPLPGLRPVPDYIDTRDLKPHQSISDKTLKEILRGEYCDLQFILPPEIEQIKETNYEAYFQDGQLLCKVKENKRDINSIVTWVEAWSRYEHLMISFHGTSVHTDMYRYKMRVLEWNKKYTWSRVYAWDMEVRKEKSGKGMDFVNMDTGLFVYHFDHSTLRNKLKPKCRMCNGPEHKGSPCPPPFRPEPGVGSGQQKPSMGQYKYGASRPDACYDYNYGQCYRQYCIWQHTCKGCGGPMPNFECKINGKCAYARNIQM